MNIYIPVATDDLRQKINGISKYCLYQVYKKCKNITYESLPHVCNIGSVNICIYKSNNITYAIAKYPNEAIFTFMI